MLTGAVLKLPPDLAEPTSRGDRVGPCAVAKLSGFSVDGGGGSEVRGCGGAVCM